MNDANHMQDLIVLVADKTMEAVFQDLLSRFDSFGIEPISFKVVVHPQNDPACLKTADQFLRSFVNQYRFALVAFDREGCGRTDNREVLELEVETKLAQVGWDQRSAVIVFEPELEIWVWSRSPHVEEILGWRNQATPLRNWLIEQNHLAQDQHKPKHPKEAMESVLKKIKRPRSSSIYSELAKTVSLKNHTEPAFVKLQMTLQQWFSQKPS